MEIELYKALVGMGALGVIAALAIIFARYKDRETRSAQKTIQDLHESYQSKIETQAKEHQVEMTALLERYISKAETWMEKWNDQAVQLRSMLSARSGLNAP